MPPFRFLRQLQSHARGVCGEFLSGRAMDEQLNPPTKARAMPTEVLAIKKRGRVLLAVEGAQPAPSALRYALEACNRANADLDLLFVGPQGGQLPSAPAGITIRSLHRPGPLDQSVAEHMQRCRELLFVITSAALSPHLLRGNTPRWPGEVPVVVLEAVA